MPLSPDDFILRAPEPEDLECMMMFENSMEQWSGNGESAGPYSRFQMRSYIESSNNNIYDDRQLRLMVQGKSGEVIGITDICMYDPFANKAEIGIIIAPEYRQKGIGSMALELFEEHCFRRLGINMLYAYIDENNRASRSLFSKRGFKESGLLMDWGRAYGSFFNAVLVQKINPF